MSADGRLDWPGCPLWDYALRLYGRPGVEAACLRLQDEHGCDVPLLLFACWLAELGRPLDAGTAAAAARLAERWSTGLTGPLRRARRALPDVAAVAPDARLAETALGLRRQIAACEQAAERLQLLQLAALVPAGINFSADRCRADLRRAHLQALATDTAKAADCLEILEGGAEALALEAGQFMQPSRGSSTDATKP